jgi:hypothetical protein
VVSILLVVVSFIRTAVSDAFFETANPSHLVMSVPVKSEYASRA